MNNFQKTLFCLLENKDNRTYICIYEMYLLDNEHKFSTCSFIVTKKILKINYPENYIDSNFINNFISHIEKEDYCEKWQQVKKNKEKLYDNDYFVENIKPNVILKDYSEKLYEKYVKYYDKIVKASTNMDYVKLIL